MPIPTAVVNSTDFSPVHPHFLRVDPVLFFNIGNLLAVGLVLLINRVEHGYQWFVEIGFRFFLIRFDQGRHLRPAGIVVQSQKVGVDCDVPEMI